MMCARQGSLARILNFYKRRWSPERDGPVPPWIMHSLKPAWEGLTTEGRDKARRAFLDAHERWRNGSVA